MLTILGGRHAACDGMTRRTMLQAGGAGLLGLSLPRLLEAESAKGSGPMPRAKSVIFLFLFGGPSQLETFDLKPDAPAEIRGPYQPVASRTPGLRICEHLSRSAAVSDKFAVIRTMSHDFNDHSGGGHYVQTGKRWQVPIGGGFNVTPNDWPSMGSVTNYDSLQKSAGKPGAIPSYVVVPNSLGRLQEYKVQLKRPGETAGWLGQAYAPLVTRVDKRDAKDNPYWRDCLDEELTYEVDGLQRLEGLTLDRMNDRSSLLEQLNAQRQLADRQATVRDYDQFREKALALVASQETRRAFEIHREPDKLRDQYGRHLFGQSTLMARRLVEAGVRFVTVHYDCVDGYSWDSHRNSHDVEKHLLPTFDQALSALLTDLDQRGLLDETLVVAMGEMGRTPRANKEWGRDHWSTLFPAVLAGAGIRGGVVHGETDRQAAFAVTPPVSPEDLAATIYHALGIDHELRLQDAFGRPQPVVEGGHPMLDLFG